MLRRLSISMLPMALAFGCDTLECGDNTHRDGDLCVANAPVACGEGTVLRDGRCVPDARTDVDAGTVECPGGTHRAGDQCVADRIFYPDCTDGEVPVAPPGCAALGTGEYCVTGTVVEIVSGCAVPANAGLMLSVIDPLASVLNPGGPPLASGPVGEGGSFGFAVGGSPTLLAVVIDEGPDAEGDVWTRSVNGVLARPPVAGESYSVIALATPGETRDAWRTTLGLEDDLLVRGFLVGRVLEADEDGLPVPAAGVQIQASGRPALTDCPDGEPCLRFFDDDQGLTGFQPVGTETTGQSGAFLLLHNGDGALQAEFSATRTGSRYPTIVAGANANSGFHVLFVPSE